MNNKADIFIAVERLIQFEHSFCIDHKKTQDGGFASRCPQCCFESDQGRCLLKQFIDTWGTDDQKEFADFSQLSTFQNHGEVIK